MGNSWARILGQHDLPNQMTILGTTEPYGTFRVTYCTVTEESAECGDFADHGYLDSWGASVDEPTSSEWDLRDLVDRFCGCEIFGDGDTTPRWVTVTPGSSDYFLDSWWQAIGGDDTIAADCSVHRPDWISDSSWRRVCRLLGWTR